MDSPLLGYTGLLLGFLFLTLSIASGLYYLSELVEEHSVLSARLLRTLIHTIIGVHMLLWLIDGFPFPLTLLGIVSHAVYASNLRHFPIVKLRDPLFILSCGLVVANHWVWFRFFEGSGLEMVGGGGGGGRFSREDGYHVSVQQQPTFTEIASYFGICVWLVPFALFVSLSAGENVLPSMGSEYATGERNEAVTQGRRRRRRNTGMAKATVDGVREWVGETGAVMGLWHGENVRRFD